MKVTQIIVDEVPDKCEYCWFCIFDGEHSADWCFAVDRHVIDNGRPTYCPLEGEDALRARIVELEAQLAEALPYEINEKIRRGDVGKTTWFKYPTNVCAGCKFLNENRSCGYWGSNLELYFVPSAKCDHFEQEVSNE